MTLFQLKNQPQMIKSSKKMICGLIALPNLKNLKINFLLQNIHHLKNCKVISPSQKLRLNLKKTSSISILNKKTLRKIKVLLLRRRKKSTRDINRMIKLIILCILIQIESQSTLFLSLSNFYQIVLILNQSTSIVVK